jgi:hypothetical protein
MKKPCYNVRHLDIRHSFDLRHSIFVVLRVETQLRRTAIIRRPAAALPISRAFHLRLPGPEV